MEWRHVHNNIVIANYGGSKQVDNDDGICSDLMQNLSKSFRKSETCFLIVNDLISAGAGSLFWKVYSNFMAYGWCRNP